MVVLKRAFVLSKSVPCPSGQNRWRGNSGFVSNLLPVAEISGKLFAGGWSFTEILRA